MFKRRDFLKAGVAGAAVTVLPMPMLGQAGMSYGFATDGGEVTVHPVSHASFALTTPTGLVFVDPVGDPAEYGSLGTPDLILITHEHGDHYNAETLAALAGDDTQIIANPAVFAMLPEPLAAKASALANGESGEALGIGIAAIPAYNTTEGRTNFHPEGRDNGYVLTIDGLAIYVSGDTEDIPEMRALSGIDIAFVCMNLPFTMDVEQAASAITDFAPTYVFPYHYRGQDGGTQDPAELASLLAEALPEAEVSPHDWYNGAMG